MKTKYKYQNSVCRIMRPYVTKKAALILAASSVETTGRHGAKLRRDAYEELGYPAKRRPSLPDKTNLHPMFAEILRPFAEATA